MFSGALEFSHGFLNAANETLSCKLGNVYVRIQICMRFLSSKPCRLVAVL